MAFHLRICKNKTTDLLRDTFKATPVNPPEEAVQPMLILARKDGKTFPRGEFRHLLKKKEQSLRIEADETTVADAALQRTDKVDFDFGVNILEALLGGFKIDAAPVKSALKNARDISFSFTNIRRRRIDLNLLGAKLREKAFDLNHPGMSIFLGSDPAEMLLISDVLVSNSLSVNVESTRDGNLGIDLSPVKQAIANAKLALQVNINQAATIQFNGDKDLTFAFSCVRLTFDPQTGAIQIGELVNPRGGQDGLESKEAAEPDFVLLDDDALTPGFLSWDQENKS